MIRKIVNIDESKCNGCGLCASACHEHAIEIVDGVAKVLDEKYCDGLGDCLPECPTGAITIVERETVAYDEDAVEKRKKEKAKKAVAPCGCPGSMARKLIRNEDNKESTVRVKSELRQWPVQLKLVNSNGDYFDGADLLVAADCTAYAYGDFHKDFIKNHVTVIGCPKLDDVEYYKEKLVEILLNNDVKSITVVRMEVPCCGGIVAAVKEAMLDSRKIVPYREVIIGVEGNIIK